MRFPVQAHQSFRWSVTANSRASATTASTDKTSRNPRLTGLHALQRSVGNAAVVQMLRQAGFVGDQSSERHEHGAGCGHDKVDEVPVQRSTVSDVLRSGGRPLDKATRADMEARLGADFSDVRVHDDATARRSAAELGARAYTSGSHIVIGDGGADRHTLAHELTHVIQQRQGPVAGTDNGNGLRVSDPSDRFEREAEANARRVLSGAASTRSLSEPNPEAPGLSAAMSSMGNAAAVQMLRTAGHPWAQGRHRHSHGRGHRTDGPVGVSGTPTVQRLIMIRPSSQEQAQLANYQQVMDFLDRHGVSIHVLASMNVQLAGADLDQRIKLAIEGMINELRPHVYGQEDAEKLARDICERISPRSSGVLSDRFLGAGSATGQQPQGLAAPPAGAGRGSGAPGQRGGMGLDPLARVGAHAAAQVTPQHPIRDGLVAGAQGAIANRVDALTSVPRVEGAPGGFQLGVWAATHGLKAMDDVIDNVARNSPNNGQELRDRYSELRNQLLIRGAAQASGAVAVSGALGRAANAIPHPAARAVGVGLSTASGVIGTVNTASDLNDRLNELGRYHPEAHRAIMERIHRDLAQMSERQRQETLRQVGNLQNQFE